MSTKQLFEHAKTSLQQARTALREVTKSIETLEELMAVRQFDSITCKTISVDTLTSSKGPTITAATITVNDITKNTVGPYAKALNDAFDESGIMKTLSTLEPTVENVEKRFTEQTTSSYLGEICK